ncbi:hypothetical protein IMZ68_04725 [Candidatus Bathyarchaeota archaeon]|nr:hypothetical protein [Candidatus Bathyarchaeota archaeon]
MIQTWDQIIKQGSQRAITTGRTGTKGTGLLPDELQALREAELDANAKNALAMRQQALNESYLEKNYALTEKGISGQIAGEKAKLGVQVGTMALPSIVKGISAIPGLFSAGAVTTGMEAASGMTLASGSSALFGAGGTAVTAAATEGALMAGGEIGALMAAEVLGADLAGLGGLTSFAAMEAGKTGVEAAAKVGTAAIVAA